MGSGEDNCLYTKNTCRYGNKQLEFCYANKDLTMFIQAK